MSVEILKGKILKSIWTDGLTEILFTVDETEVYRMFHRQDCCESVTIDDICGNLQDLVGSPILIAEMSTNRNNDKEQQDTVNFYNTFQDSFTWTFYRFATLKGYLTLKWYGESNGYYSEEVDFERIQ